MIFNILYESCPKIRDTNFLGMELSPYPYLFSRYFRILYRTRQKLTGHEIKTCRRILLFFYFGAPSSLLITYFPVQGTDRTCLKAVLEKSEVGILSLKTVYFTRVGVSLCCVAIVLIGKVACKPLGNYV